MPYPTVAIVGRPNVGKSTLFNRLVGSRIAIEAPTSGVTRDRVLFPLILTDPETGDDRTVDLIDTGGIGIVDRQNLEADVEKQITVAIDQAALLIFLVDARDEVTPLDEEVAGRLRRAGKTVLLVANKVDTPSLEEKLPSFHALGFGDALPVSAKHKRNIADLEEALLRRLPPAVEDEDPHAPGDLLRIAFVGRRNVGKSTLINQLAGDERVIVSDAPGTTRDALDVRIERDGETFVAIDTAGLRKRGQMDDIMEFFGHVRTERAVRRADVVVLILDATTQISKVDKRIGHLVVEEHKPCIVALNKWDLVKEKDPSLTVESFQPYIADRLPGLWFCRLAGISAREGVNVWGLVTAARSLAKQASQQVTTGKINTALGAAQKKRRPRPFRGKVGKIYYGTQSDVSPPTFLLFCNNPALFDKNYMRYIENHLRRELGFAEVPLQLILKTSREKEVGRYDPE